MILRKLTFQIGRQPDTSQGPGLRKEGFGIEHVEGKEQLEAMRVVLCVVLIIKCGTFEEESAFVMMFC
jgi:hypothetical protein